MKKIINVPVKNCKPIMDVDFNPDQRLTAENCKGKKVGTFRIKELVVDSSKMQLFHCECERCGYIDILTLREMYDIHTPYCLENN